MGAILSFLTGSAFRLIWSQIAEYLNKRQEHSQELSRMELQAKLDDNRHKNDCERIRLQSELGVTEMRVQAEGEVDKLDAMAFVESMKNAMPPISSAPTGNKWLDAATAVVVAWNNLIRPLGASIGYYLVVAELASLHWVMGDWHRALVGTMLGFFFASRELAKGRK